MYIRCVYIYIDIDIVSYVCMICIYIYTYDMIYCQNHQAVHDCNLPEASGIMGIFKHLPIMGIFKVTCPYFRMTIRVYHCSTRR